MAITAIHNKLLLFFLLFFSTNIVFAKKASPMQKVSVGLFHKNCKPDHLPLEVAEAQGWFKDEGILIKKSFFTEKWKKGGADLEKTQQDLIVLGRAKLYYAEATVPSKFKLFVANVIDTEHLDYAIIAKKDSHVVQLSDLVNKTIGLEPSSGHAKFALMDIILQKNKLSQNEYSLKVASTDDLDSGAVEALYLREPALSIARSSGKYKVIVDAPVTKYIMSPWPQGFSAISTNFLKKHPVEARKIVNIYNKAIDFIRSKPEVVADMSRKCLKKHYKVEAQYENPFIFWKLTEFKSDIIQKQIDLYFEKKLIPKKINVTDIMLDI